MLIRDRIFQKLEESQMTQKEFSQKTGIPESTISDWRKKRTNPTAEKIMIICRTLDVTPEWLLSGIEAQGTRGNPQKWHVVDAETDSGRLLTSYNSLDARLQQRLGICGSFKRTVQGRRAEIKYNSGISRLSGE